MYYLTFNFRYASAFLEVWKISSLVPKLRKSYILILNLYGCVKSLILLSIKVLKI